MVCLKFTDVIFFINNHLLIFPQTQHGDLRLLVTCFPAKKNLNGSAFTVENKQIYYDNAVLYWPPGLTSQAQKLRPQNWLRIRKPWPTSYILILNHLTMEPMRPFGLHMIISWVEFFCVLEALVSILRKKLLASNSPLEILERWPVFHPIIENPCFV